MYIWALTISQPVMNDHSAMDMPINENLKASQFTIGKYFLVDFYCFGPGTFV